MSESNLKAALSDKRILFVDDEPPLVADYRDALRGAGLDVLVVKDLNSAMKLIRDESAMIGLVLVDLRMPGDRPDELATRYPDLTKANGQLLGQWLWDARKGNPRHAYFTALPHVYQPHPNAGQQEFGDIDQARTIFILDKFDIRPSELSGRLSDVWTKWDALLKAVEQ